MRARALALLTATLALAGCASSHAPGRVPYDASNPEQLFSPQQIAILTQCGDVQPITKAYALGAATCRLGSAHITIAVFQPRSNEKPYLSALKAASPHARLEVGPYWVASSDDASSDDLRRFAPGRPIGPSGTFTAY